MSYCNYTVIITPCNLALAGQAVLYRCVNGTAPGRELIPCETLTAHNKVGEVLLIGVVLQYLPVVLITLFAYLTTKFTKAMYVCQLSGWFSILFTLGASALLTSSVINFSIPQLSSDLCWVTYALTQLGLLNVGLFISMTTFRLQENYNTFIALTLILLLNVINVILIIGDSSLGKPNLLGMFPLVLQNSTVLRKFCAIPSTWLPVVLVIINYLPIGAVLSSHSYHFLKKKYTNEKEKIQIRSLLILVVVYLGVLVTLLTFQHHPEIIVDNIKLNVIRAIILIVGVSGFIFGITGLSFHHWRKTRNQVEPREDVDVGNIRFH